MPYFSISFALQVIFIIHAAKTGRFWPWAYVILFLPVVGALAYVAFELAPEWFGTSQGRATRVSLVTKLNPNRRLRSLQENLETADTIANRSALAEELLVRGEDQEALSQFQHLLSLPHGKAPNHFLGLARAELGLNNFEAALAAIETCRKEYPTTKNVDVDLLHAIALDMAGRTDEALLEYNEVAGRYAGVEPRVRRAALLMRLGHAEEARKAANDIVQRVSRSPKHVRKVQAQWLAEAKKIVKSS